MRRNEGLEVDTVSQARPPHLNAPCIAVPGGPVGGVARPQARGAQDLSKSTLR